MNKVIMQGNFAKEHFYKINEKGNAFLSNSIIIKNKKTNEYFNIIAFGQTAEAIAEEFKKGDVFSFEGELRNNVYEKDGKKTYSVQIIVQAFNSKNTEIENDEFPF